MNFINIWVSPKGVSRQVRMTASGRKEAGRSQEKGPEPNQEQTETPRTHHSQAGPTSRSEYAGHLQ